MAALVGVVGAVVLLARPAHAGCPPDVAYDVSKAKSSWLMSDVRSEWAQPGFEARYTKTTTAEVNASITGTVEADAGVVFAKVKSSLGVTVGGSWSKSDSYSYSKKVPKGKKWGRIVMYHESLKFKVTKKILRPNCKYDAVYTETVDAPLKKGKNVIRMQLRKFDGPPNVAANEENAKDDEEYEEIDLEVIPDVEGELTTP